MPEGLYWRQDTAKRVDRAMILYIHSRLPRRAGAFASAIFFATAEWPRCHFKYFLASPNYCRHLSRIASITPMIDVGTCWLLADADGIARWLWPMRTAQIMRLLLLPEKWCAARRRSPRHTYCLRACSTCLSTFDGADCLMHSKYVHYRSMPAINGWPNTRYSLPLTRQVWKLCLVRRHYGRIICRRRQVTSIRYVLDIELPRIASMSRISQHCAARTPQILPILQYGTSRASLSSWPSLIRTYARTCRGTLHASQSHVALRLKCRPQNWHVAFYSLLALMYFDADYGIRREYAPFSAISIWRALGWYSTIILMTTLRANTLYTPFYRANSRANTRAIIDGWGECSIMMLMSISRQKLFIFS